MAFAWKVPFITTACSDLLRGRLSRKTRSNTKLSCQSTIEQRFGYLVTASAETLLSSFPRQARQRNPALFFEVAPMMQVSCYTEMEVILKMLFDQQHF